MSHEINTCPVETVEQHLTLRHEQGTGAIIPCAGEPVCIRNGEKVVWASNGVERGWYSYTTDVFTPEGI